jgi:ligand-binding sensor domain-containing protein
MKAKVFFAGILLMWFTPWLLKGQPTLFYSKITVADGLNDGGIQAICRDKQGYMWFSTIGGLNRYDGTNFTFTDRVESDSGRVAYSICRSIVSDSSGRLFFAFENGLGEYDFRKQQVHIVPAVGDTWVLDMFSVNDTTLMLITYTGWMRYNPIAGTVLKDNQISHHSLFSKRPGPWAFNHNKLFVADNGNVAVYHFSTNALQQLKLPASLPKNKITHLAIDVNENLWLRFGMNNNIARVHLPGGTFKIYPTGLPIEDLGVNQLLCHPKQNTLWIATSANGILQYVPDKDSFIRHEHNPLLKWTLNTNLIRTIYIDKDSSVWLGGDYGVNFAHPSRALFEIIPPFDTDITNRNRRMARVATEDNDGNLWFGTMDGVVRYNPLKKSYEEFNNRAGKAQAIFYNSIRGLVTDKEGDVWIATGRGINRYRTKTGKMDFFTEKDSIINGFFFSANMDNDGNIWFSCRDGASLYYYQRSDKKFFNIASHKTLRMFAGAGCRIIVQDSKRRYWIGFNGTGLAMYNPVTEQVETWNSLPGKNGPISGNYVVDIKEDRKGAIWISTFNGLTCIDPTTMAIKNYTTVNGLLSNTVAPLAVDSLDRIWIGTARGLMMLDADRKTFTPFGEADGLPEIGFQEHAGFVARNGNFIMGTLNGYIRFDPLKFQQEKLNVQCYIGNVQVGSAKKSIQVDTLENLHLSHFQNSITINLVGINYKNRQQTWYAYLLEGFEKQWHYTQDPKIVYTNLPGGKYRFLYKAGTNAYQWDRPAKALEIKIDTVFYKTPWFIMLIGLLMAGLLYWIYRFRLSQQQQVFALQSKTQVLEKEKAQVMYENLKQHLNPHFLFNSLTSLSSLIRINQDMAGNFLERMSKIYRYILKNRDSETVTLQEELNFVSNYIELQKTRFENGLQVHIMVDDEHMYKRIAPVTLQNLVENAIKHNTTSRQKPLIIDFFVQDEYLIVSNSLQRKTFVETSNKTGLESMKDLYSYLSERPLLVEEDGDRFVVRVPLL